MTAYPKRELEVVPESNDDDGRPTLWSVKGDYDNGAKRHHYVWISKYDEKLYVVEDSYGRNLSGKVFKTLWGAKREAEGIIWRQDESGAYTD